MDLKPENLMMFNGRSERVLPNESRSFNDPDGWLVQYGLIPACFVVTSQIWQWSLAQYVNISYTSPFLREELNSRSVVFFKDSTMANLSIG